MSGAIQAPVLFATSSATAIGWIRSADSGRWGPWASTAPTGRITTVSGLTAFAKSALVMSARCMAREGRWREYTLSLGDISPRRARRSPLLRREGLHLCRLRGDAAGLGGHPPRHHRPGGQRVHDVPRPEPPPHAAPRGGDGAPARHRQGGSGGDRGARRAQERPRGDRGGGGGDRGGRGGLPAG